MNIVNPPQSLAAAPLISVVGAGAIGSLLAGLLSRAERPVELVCRPAQRDALAGGLHVQSPHGEFSVHLAVKTAISPPAALVVVAVKLPDLEATCRQIATVFASAALPPVLLLQNGLEAVDLARRAIPPDRLIVGVVELGATMLTPGAITYTIPGRLIVGTPAGGSPAIASAAAAMLRPAIPIAISADIAAAQRLKLIVNLNNGLTAATGLTIQQLYADPTGPRLSVRLMREGITVMDAARLSLGATPRTRLLRLLLALPDPLAALAFRVGSRKLMGRLPVHSSTLQSILRGRATEIDALNGAIVQLGEQHGVPTPANVAVVDAVQRAAARQPPAFTSPKALLHDGRNGDVPSGPSTDGLTARQLRRGGPLCLPWLRSRTTIRVGDAGGAGPRGRRYGRTHPPVLSRPEPTNEVER